MLSDYNEALTRSGEIEIIFLLSTVELNFAMSNLFFKNSMPVLNCRLFTPHTSNSSSAEISRRENLDRLTVDFWAYEHREVTEFGVARENNNV